MNSINLNMKSVEVKTETRAIKAEWTREMATDISQFKIIDYEDYIAKEVRREMRKISINKIFKN